jgi:hypothetical protein
MDVRSVYLRTTADLEEDLAQRMNDWPDDTWTTSQKLQGLNASLNLWVPRVRVPFLYTISGGFVSGTYIYDLPDYIEGPIDVQFKALTGYYIGSQSSDDRRWEYVNAFDVDVSSDGGRELRLHYDVFNTDARIFWWGFNGPIPRTSSHPVTDGGVTIGATSLDIASQPVIGQAGYVKVDNEWMSYAGYDENTDGTLTLENLGRGQFNTTAAAHGSGDTVNWGIAAPRRDLYEQLMYEAAAYLHMLKLNDASQQERSHHTDQMLTYKQMADEFWNRYYSQRPARFRLSRRAIGPGVGTMDYRVVTSTGNG